MLFSPPYPPLSICIEKYNFLGISIVGQSNDRGDGGIYIGSIMKGGAVAADGRIEPGDMLLQVGPCPKIHAAGLYLGGSAQSSHQILVISYENSFMLRELCHKDC